MRILIKVKMLMKTLKDELLEKIEEIQPAITSVRYRIYFQGNSLLRKERKNGIIMLQLIENDKIRETLMASELLQKNQNY